MKGIKIEPFPNWDIENSVIERDVKKHISTSSKIKKIVNKVMMTINFFNNGDRRVNFMIPEEYKGRTYMSVFPNPIQLYFSYSIDALKTADALRLEEFPKYSKKIKDEEKYILNITSDETHPIYNSYLQFKISSIIMLTCSLEAFINSMIKEDFEHLDINQNKLTQEQIQRKLSIKEKITIVMPQYYRIDFKSKYKTDYDLIMSLVRLRNEFVHLKNYNKSPMSTEYQSLFLDLMKFKSYQSIKSVKNYINTYKPNFIKEQN